MLAYLVGVGVLGGSELRASIERELGNLRYLPDEMYPALHLVVICDRAVRAGLSVSRLGELVFPAFKRARPELFAGKDVMDGFRLMERASREDSGYYGNQAWPEPTIEAGHAVSYRPGRPTPCEAYVGTIQGMLQSFGVKGTATETACLWQGSAYCTFEAHWR